jgi:adenine-specific DNA-methyltransferase
MTEYALKKELYITRDLYLRRIVSDTRYKTLKDILPRIGDDSDVSHNDDININDLFASGWGSNEDADEELRLLLGTQKLLDYPKPLRLISKLIVSNRNTKDTVCMDFFSGSCTTGQAVMKLNTLDDGKRKFILVQLPEACLPDSAAYKAGFINICELGKERLRRAGEKVKSEAGLMAQDLDIGFRVLKLDDSNMKEVYYSPDEYSQSLLTQMESNIKEDRTDLDLLFSCLLEWGLPLSLPYTSETVDGCTIHTYNNGDLIACFNENVPESVIREIAKRQPLRVVFRDSSFASSPEKINVEEIFKLLAPNTSVKVL